MRPNDDASAVVSRVYSASDIQILTAVDAIRKRPGMYVGDTHDGSGLHHLAKELVEYALLEHLEGRLFRIAVTLHRAGALTVEDDGPGLPVDAPRGPDSVFQLFFTELGQCWRARSPFGIGHTVVNAMSERLFVEVHRAGTIHSQEFRAGRPIAPARLDGASDRTGTRITLRPDPGIFSSVVFDGERLLVRLREIAFLHPGLRIDFVDERKGRRESLQGQSISTWMERLTEGQLARPEQPLRMKGVCEGIHVDVALRWTSASRAPRVRGFVNAFPVRSGSHLKGRWAGLRGPLATRSSARSVWAGLVAILNLRGPGLDAELSGCCRDELESNAVARAVGTVVNAGLTRELAASPALRDSLFAPDRFVDRRDFGEGRAKRAASVERLR
jgi:DNA gyrase subunit B